MSECPIYCPRCGDREIYEVAPLTGETRVRCVCGIRLLPRLRAGAADYPAEPARRIPVPRTETRICVVCGAPFRARPDMRRAWCSTPCRWQTQKDARLAHAIAKGRLPGTRGAA